jgi:hypothetical protein
MPTEDVANEKPPVTADIELPPVGPLDDRHLYGATAGDVTATRSGDIVGGVTLTVWDARTGGTQVTDLVTIGETATGTVTSDTDGNVLFYGPADSIDSLWVDSGVGSRVVLKTADIELPVAPESTDYLFDGLLTTGDSTAVSLGGASGNYISAPSSSGLNVTSDLDIRWIGSLADWTPGTAQGLFTHYQSPDDRGWLLELRTNGLLRIWWAPLGNTGEINRSSTVATGFADGDTGGVRVTIEASTGVVSFYTSTDLGSTWDLLGTTVGSGGATSIYTNIDAPIEIGAYNGGTGYPGTFAVRSAELRDGIDGTVLASPDFTEGIVRSDGQGNLWDIHGNVASTRKYATPSGVPLTLAGGGDADLLQLTDLSGNVVAKIEAGGTISTAQALKVATGASGGAAPLYLISADTGKSQILWQSQAYGSGAIPTDRWVMEKIGPESGGNAGSDWILEARSDTGGILHNERAMHVKRSTNNVEFGGNVQASSYTDKITTVTATTYTLTAADSVVLSKAHPNAATITLPTAVGVRGRRYQIKNIVGNVATVDTTGSETIDGAATVSLSRLETLSVISSGTEWLTI